MLIYRWEIIENKHPGKVGNHEPVPVFSATDITAIASNNSRGNKNIISKRWQWQMDPIWSKGLRAALRV